MRNVTRARIVSPARRRRREMHNVEWTVEGTKLIVTIELAAITRDGDRASPLIQADLAKNDLWENSSYIGAAKKKSRLPTLFTLAVKVSSLIGASGAKAMARLTGPIRRLF